MLSQGAIIMKDGSVQLLDVCQMWSWEYKRLAKKKRTKKNKKKYSGENQKLVRFMFETFPTAQQTWFSGKNPVTDGETPQKT